MIIITAIKQDIFNLNYYLSHFIITSNFYFLRIIITTNKMSKLEMKIMHKVIWKHNEIEKPDLEMGFVMSLNDCNNSLVIDSSKCFMFRKMVKWMDYEGKNSFSRENCESFLLLAREKNDINSHIRNIIKRLEQKKDLEAGYVVIDKIGKYKGLIGPANENEKIMMGGNGFRCYILPQEENLNDESIAMQIIDNNNNSNNSSKRGHEQMLAAGHYNDLKRDKNTRHLSQIFHLRQLNNWIKSALISTTLKQHGTIPPTVLDLGCGMGGDILKWLKGSVYGIKEYVGVDIAHNSLKHFISERISNQREFKSISKLICADMGVDSLISSKLETHKWNENSQYEYGKIPTGQWRNIVPLSVTDTFNIASCQFAIHYMFQSQSKANHFFDQVSRHLKIGGQFIVSTMDCRVLAQMLAEEDSGVLDDNCDYDDNESKKMKLENTINKKEKILKIKNELGNNILKITFEESMWKKLLLENNKNQSNNNKNNGDNAFGIEYDFSLFDSDDAQAVNAPEWIVPMGEPLHELANSHGMIVKKCLNCQDFIYEGMEDHFLRSNMEKVYDYKGTISEAEWKIARLYAIIVFERVDTLSQSKLPTSPNSPPPDDYKDNITPISPDMPPPMDPMPIFMPNFAPMSPDSPPPCFIPTSPDTSPPKSFMTLLPTSPDSPPQNYINNDTFMPSFIPTNTPPAFVMTSPNNSPPFDNNSYGIEQIRSLSPQSPDEPPPDFIESDDDSDDDNDVFLIRFTKIRQMAIDLVGGQERWDILSQDDTEKDKIISFVTKQLDEEESSFIKKINLPTSPNEPPPIDNCPRSPDEPPPDF